ncbi:Protein M02D8.1 [Aphelenchoides avenae]|nr:Protein M02D8.1 [Aphelenchus avenae]
MAPPTIEGEPTISHIPAVGPGPARTVVLEVVVAGADPNKVQWFFEEDPIRYSEDFMMTVLSLGDDRSKFICQIRNFDKSLQGTYKAVFTSDDGQTNYCHFAVFPRTSIEEMHWGILPDRDEVNAKPVVTRCITKPMTFRVTCSETSQCS